MPTDDEIRDALEGWGFWRKYLSEHAPQSVVREKGDDLAHIVLDLADQRLLQRTAIQSMEERYAESIAAEREACAKVCDDLADERARRHDETSDREALAFEESAAAIRARGAKEEK